MSEAILKHVILEQEVGPVPINNLHVGFLGWMDIEFIEHHHRFFLRVVERPLLRLTVGRNVCAERRIASLLFR